MEDFAQNPCSSVPSVPHAQPVRFQAVTYQLVGDKMKPRVAYFDLSLIPDPQAWLEERLGKVKSVSPFKENDAVMPAAGRSLRQNP
jgi:hypothetical protein